MIDKFVEGVEFDFPEKIFSGAVSQNSEVLDLVLKLDAERKVALRSFAVANDKRTVWSENASSHEERGGRGIGG